MNVLHKVTLQALKQNRTRTIVTIIGIILSTAMLCAVTTFTTSFQQFILDDSVYSSGSWHLGQKDTTYRQYQELSQADGVAEAVYLQHLGYAESGTNLDDYMPYLYVLGLSPQGTDLLPLRLSQGRMPTASNEIVLFQSFLDASTQYYQLGDTITLGLGQRMSQGFALGEQNPYNYDDGETLEVRETRTYTVVGICNWWGLYSYSSPGYPAFTVADSNLAEDTTCDVYLAMEDISQAYDFQQAHNLDEDNGNVLMYSGVSRYDTFYTVLYRLAAIVMVIIIVASVVLIYNAFAISVSERTRQFGLLSSLGATKKQMRNMVRFEALVLSAIGVPLGILSGILGIGITLHFIGTLFTTSSMSGGVAMRLHVSWVGVLVAVVLGVAAGSWIWYLLPAGSSADPFEYRYDHGWEEEEDASGAVTIPTYPFGEGAVLEVETDHGRELTAQEIYQRVNPSVVTVMVQLDDSVSVGTGVISSPITTCWRGDGTAPSPWTRAGPMRPGTWPETSGTIWRSSRWS